MFTLNIGFRRKIWFQCFWQWDLCSFHAVSGVYPEWWEKQSQIIILHNRGQEKSISKYTQPWSGWHQVWLLCQLRRRIYSRMSFVMIYNVNMDRLTCIWMRLLLCYRCCFVLHCCYMIDWFRITAWIKVFLLKWPVSIYLP